MDTRAAAIVAVVMVTSCGSYGAEAFHCDSDQQCSGGGTCEPGYNLCSFPVDTDVCSSGRQFGDHAGGQSGKCVGGGPPIDSGIDSPDARPDAPPDARVCFGTAPFAICLAAAPTMPLTIASATPIDTTNSSLCVATVSGGSNYCVIAATTITIDLRLRAIGSKPLVLLASDTITATALIDVGSHRSPVESIGAGADPATCVPGTLPGTAGGTGGGGAGGSFLNLGGVGGLGGGGTSSAGGTPGAGVSTVTEVRGGCSGQDGDGSEKGMKGHGGGAVFLIAGTKIDVKVGINAGGEGGTGGGGSVSGGGGGGAGGMIGFDAPVIMSAGPLFATGGGGGEGSDMPAGAAGATGSDATSTTAAAGGVGNTPKGGDGGDGSIAAATAGGAGHPGDSTGTTRGGGGGGGGGAGLIKAPVTATLGNQVAPAATP